MEGHENIQAELDKYIDMMYECASHYSFGLQLRCSLTGQSSFPKTYVKKFENQLGFSSDTNLGTISFVPTYLISGRKKDIEDTLEHIF